MSDSLLGIHHVTAIAGDPQRNLDFYTDTLGLRLVKKTVNFDDPGTYHFYFGDGAGDPGTIMTFFPWPQARRGRLGTGETTTTSFAVPLGSLDFWLDRLNSRSVSVGAPSERFGELTVRFADPDGLALELVASEAVPGAPWDESAVSGKRAISGFHGATIAVRRLEATERLLTGPLGFRRVGTEGDRTRFALAGAGRARYLDVVLQPDMPRGTAGAGSVHHIAWRVDSDASQLGMQEELAAARTPTTTVRDRQYFHSIYFREPGGVLFEIATDPPGFTLDEPLEDLGSELKLPPWLESDRDHIEAALPVVRPVDRAQRGAA